MSHSRPGEGIIAEMFYDSTTIGDADCSSREYAKWKVCYRMYTVFKNNLCSKKQL